MSTGAWSCGLCADTGIGGYEGLHAHYLRHHYVPPMVTHKLPKGRGRGQ